MPDGVQLQHFRRLQQLFEEDILWCWQDAVKGKVVSGNAQNRELHVPAPATVGGATSLRGQLNALSRLRPAATKVQRHPCHTTQSKWRKC